jgi:hypothetical protein
MKLRKIKMNFQKEVVHGVKKSDRGVLTDSFSLVPFAFVR